MRIFKISVASLKDLVKKNYETFLNQNLTNVVLSNMLMFLFVTYS